MTIFQDLKRRGLIAQMSHEADINRCLTDGCVKFYTGFDATADSLHVGHMVQLITMSRLQRAGHQPFALLGTATTLIGDPSGKTDMRKMLDGEQIAHNAECFRKQMSGFLNFEGDGGAEIVRNGDWFADVKYLEFLRDVGRHFTVNRMLAAECFKSRLDTGLTFLEFNYMLLQSYDFLHLYRTHGVRMQLGGDDQWSNILAGVDLIRRVEGTEAQKAEAFAMTFALLATKDGKKMGKTEKGALWLDADRTSPYDFYQYFRNVDDGDVVDLLKKMTFIPIDELEELEQGLEGKGFNSAKERLAYELTALVHGSEEAGKAQNAAKSIFGAGTADANMPTVAVVVDESGNIGILDLIVQTELCKSKREARTAAEQGGISVDGAKITDVNAVITIGDFAIVQKGKKTFIKAVKQ